MLLLMACHSIAAQGAPNHAIAGLPLHIALQLTAQTNEASYNRDASEAFCTATVTQARLCSPHTSLALSGRRSRFWLGIITTRRSNQEQPQDCHPRAKEYRRARNACLTVCNWWLLYI